MLIVLSAREFLQFREVAKKYKVPFVSKVKNGNFEVRASEEKLKMLGYGPDTD